MTRTVLAVMICAGCEFGGGPGVAGRITDGSTKPVDAAKKPDGPGSGSGSNMSMCAQPMASGVVATWAFAGQPGNQASTAAASAAPGTTAGAIARSSDLAADVGLDSMNSTTWPMTSTLDTTKGYYTLSITPPANCTLDLTAASIQGRQSGSGPASVAIGTSADGFAQTVALTVSPTDATSTPALAVTGAAAAVELRIFGYGASGTAGTFRLDGTLTVTGSIQ